MSESSHIVCSHCDAVNRLPVERLTDNPKCGKCHAALFQGEPLILTATNFQTHLERNGVPLLVDFWAPWCGPCKVMAPAFAQATLQLEPRVRLAKLDTEAEQRIASRFAIRSIPTLVLFQQGKERARKPGAMGASDIVRWALSHL